MQMKRAVIFLLLLCMLGTGILSSCATKKPSGNNETVETKPSDTTNAEEEGLFPKIRDDMPSTMDFGAKKVRMAVRSNERFYSEFNTESGGVLSDALYERILNIEDRLNIQIEICPDINSTHGPWENISNSIMTGSCTYQVAAGSSYKAASFAMQGEYRNLRNLEHLNFEKAYWSQGMIENLTVADATYFATGSLSTYFWDSAYVIYFNKQLASNYDIDAAALYQKVLDGAWTLDEMLEVSKGVYLDLNHNGVEDDGDLFGFGIQVTSATDGFWSAFDIRNTELTEDGNIRYMLDVEKLDDVVSRLNRFVWEQSGTVALSENAGYASTNVYELKNQFASDQIMFLTDLLYRTSTSAMRDMKSDYGVLPYPKYDTTQESYRSFVHDQMTIFGVPVTVSDSELEMVGAFLEAMASEGQNTVMPVYYKKVLTSRNIRDLQSVKTLDIILSSIAVDRIWFYNYSVGRINNVLLREQVWNNKNEISSTYRSNYETVNNLLLTVREKYEKYKDR
ncbi:MAG TPA: hypothetical protein DDW30_01145 [Clostridiales bacterium]|nr:hypothetical protein [Clostridiales bacterium]